MGSSLRSAMDVLGEEQRPAALPVVAEAPAASTAAVEPSPSTAVELAPATELALPTESGTVEERIAEVERFLESPRIPPDLRTQFENRLFSLQEEQFSDNSPIPISWRQLKAIRAAIIVAVVREIVNFNVGGKAS